MTTATTASPLIDEQLDERECTALAAGDAAAWERQYRQIHGPLYGYCLRLSGDETAALDLVQESFARTIKRCRERGTPTGLRAYLYTSARNMHVDEARRRGRTDARSAEDVATSMPDTDAAIRDTDPDTGALVGEQRDDVRAALAALPDRQRQALALCDMEGCSYGQVAEALDLNENAVAQLVFRARGRLRLALRMRQIDEQSLPEGCRDNLEPISRLIDGALKGEQLATLTAHLEECEICRGVREDFQLVQQRYRAFAPLLPLGADDAWAQMLERTSAREHLVSGGRATRRLTRRLPVAIGALVIVALCVGALGVAAGIGDSGETVAARATSAKQKTGGEQTSTQRASSGKRKANRKNSRTSEGATAEQDERGTDDQDENDPASGEGSDPRPADRDPKGEVEPADGDTDASTEPDPVTTTEPDPEPAPPPPPPPAPANLVATGINYTGSSVVVSISNTGGQTAGWSTVRVKVGSSTYTASVGAISAGSGTSVSVHTGCREGTFSFSATVDVYGAVSESNEGDNYVSGSTSNVC